MSRPFALKLGFLALLLCTLSAAPAETAPSSPDNAYQKLASRFKDLMSQNANLRERNAELERHLTEMSAKLWQLESQLKVPAKIVIPPLRYTPLLTPRLTPNGQPLPEGWHEGRFNGLPYYVVPLQGNGSDPVRTVP